MVMVNNIFLYNWPYFIWLKLNMVNLFMKCIEYDGIIFKSNSSLEQNYKDAQQREKIEGILK